MHSNICRRNNTPRAIPEIVKFGMENVDSASAETEIKGNMMIV